MGKKTFILTEDLHIQDPHDVFLTLFNPSNKETILDGSESEFIKRTVLLVLAFIAMLCLFSNYLPGIIEILVTIVGTIVGVYAVSFVVGRAVPFLLSARSGFLFCCIIVISISVFFW